MNKIPLIIHQIWFQGQKTLNSKYADFQQRWKELHPKWIYIFWDENKIINLLRKHYEWFFDTWNKLPFMIQKIDSAKIFILHFYGGMYIDMDMEPIMNIEPLLRAPLLLSRCYVHHILSFLSKFIGLKNFSKTQINNAFIACSKKHPVMWNTLILMKENIELSKHIIHQVMIAKSCGTEVMIEGLNEELKKNPLLNYYIYPPEFFEPKVKIRNKEPLITKNTRVIHHSDRTWVKDSPLSRRLFIFLTIVSIIIATVVTSIVFILRKYKNLKIPYILIYWYIF